MNKYERWYAAITENAKHRTLNGYTEQHHIVPRSLGGTDDLDNLVELTAREHFVCHWLLTKIHPTGEEHWRMINAFRMMRAKNPRQQRYQTAITGRVYENLKQEYSQLQSQCRRGSGNGFYGKNHSEDAKRRISQANTGRIQPLAEKEKQIKAMTGRKRETFSEEWKSNLSKNHRSKRSDFDGSHNEETKQKMRERALGRKQSPETIKKKADAIRGLKREKKTCPHCQQQIAVNTYTRWHGDRCRQRLNIVQQHSS